MALPNNPQTRKEMYLSNMAGYGTALPSEPHTREEEYLDYIAKNGGGGGTGEGDMTKAVYDDDLAVASAGGIADYVAGAITGKVDKVQGKGLSTNDYDDSAKAIVDGVTTELGNKADKVSSATNGDLASLDSNGNLTDSGKKASDFYNSSETLETELDGQDKFPFYDFSASAKRQVTFGSIKAKLKEYFDLFYTNLVSSATNGNFAGLDANGNLTDSGKKASDFATASSVTAILDGTTIDSFSDVESALADKVDVVSGKGLSTNDYDNTAKGIVDNIQSNVIANTKLIKDTVGWSGKNKNGSKYTGITTQGMTFTVNPDNSVKGNGTNSSSSNEARPIYTNFNLKAGSYKFSCKNATANFYAFVWDVTNSRRLVTVTDSADHEFSVDSDIEAGVLLSVITEVTINNQTLYPMIRDADILDSTYEPYFGSTAFPRSEQAVLGAKNLFKNTGINDTIATVVFTHNSNDTTSLSGTASETAFYTLGSLANLVGITENVILTGCPEGGSPSNGISIGVRTAGRKNVRYNNADIVDIGNGFTFNPSVQLKDSDGNNVNLADLLLVVRIGGSVNTTGKILYPMIRLATDPDDTYVPYAMTNRELTDEVEDLDGHRQFTKAGDITTTVTTQNVPSTAKEIAVQVYLNNSYSANGIIVIPTNLLSINDKYFHCGAYFTSSDNSGGSVKVKIISGGDYQVTFDKSYANGVELTITTKATVYYR